MPVQVGQEIQEVLRQGGLNNQAFWNVTVTFQIGLHTILQAIATAPPAMKIHPRLFSLALVSFPLCSLVAPAHAAGEAASATPAAPAAASADSAEAWRGAIKAGRKEAYVQLGFCYELGIGGEAVDLALALQCFREGDRQGSPAATFQLALCTAAGMSCSADSKAAFECLQKSARLGCAPAVAALARAKGQTWNGEFDFMRRVTTPSPVFGAEATRLFQALSGEYRLKQGVCPETPSPATLARALHSADPGIAAIARPHQEFLELEAKETFITGKDDQGPVARDATVPGRAARSAIGRRRAGLRQ